MPKPFVIKNLAPLEGVINFLHHNLFTLLYSSTGFRKFCHNPVFIVAVKYTALIVGIACSKGTIGFGTCCRNLEAIAESVYLPNIFSIVFVY